MDKFFALLTDLSFRRSATPHLVKFFYVFSLVICAVMIVLTILSGFSRGIVSGVISLVVAPIIALFYVCAIRLGLEAMISLYRTANYLAELARAQRPPAPDMEPPPTEPEPKKSQVGASKQTVLGKSGF